MGTRNLTMVIKDDELKVCQYGQWDGYFTYAGKRFMEFCYNKLSNNSLIDDFSKKVDKLKVIDIKAQDMYNKVLDECNKSDYYIPMKILYPQFHRDTGVDILNIIDSIQPYEIPDNKYFPILLDVTDVENWIEYAYLIDLDNKKIYMFTCHYVEKPKRIATDRLKKLLPFKIGRKAFKCFLSYSLLELPKVEDLLSDYNKQHVEETTNEVELKLSDLSLYLVNKEVEKDNN